MFGRRALVVWLCAAALYAAPASADDAQAAFDRGLADMQAEKYETGCPALAESFRLDPQPGALFTLATCEARWGKLASAIRRYDQYLVLFAAMTPAAQADQSGRDKIAAEHKAALGRLVPQVTIVLAASAPKDTVVLYRGEAIDAGGSTAPLSLDPGEHVFVTKSAIGTLEHRFVLAPGERRRIEVGGAPPAVAKRPPRPAERPVGSSYRSWALAALGLGVAGVATGTILGLRATSEKSTLDDACDENNDCEPEGLEALDRARALAAASTVAFAIGGLGVAAGVTLLLLDGSDNPAGVAVHGGWSW